MSEYSYSSRDSSRSHSRAHGGGPYGGSSIYGPGAQHGYAASTTSFDSVNQLGLGNVPYTTTSPRVVPSSIPTPRIDTNVHHPPRAAHVKHKHHHDSTTSFGSSVDGSTYSSSPSPNSYSPSPHTPYSPSPLNPNRAPPMNRSNTDGYGGISRQADESYHVERSDDEERSERRARKKQEKLRRAKSHSDVRDSASTFSNDTSSTFSYHHHPVPPLPSGASQYGSGGSIHRGAGGSISSSNYGAPETPRAQAFSRLDARDPNASSHRTKSTRSRRDADNESRYGGGSDAGSTRSSKRAPSVASSKRAPSIASSHHAPSIAGSQYALQPYAAPTLTAGQTPIPPPGSNYSFGTPGSVAGYQDTVAKAQQAVYAANASIASASQVSLAYNQQSGVQHVPGQPNNVYHVGTNINVFVNSAEDLGKITKELKGMKTGKEKGGSLFKNMLIKKRRSFD
ncbi:hypothetical protein PENSPDRAFT_684078 [Peniophora sp. CONT]|nr:hypothetical protein PENSPDRAFT_684078 [Peniophora sp. CONT]